MKTLIRCVFAALLVLVTVPASAQEYFVAYSHQMEEPGNLELASRSLFVSPKDANGFVSNEIELEYGVRTWWTSELYFDGQSTFRESTVFTGFKFENRFRPLLREHRINPVLYIEWVNANSADKSVREIVGHDSRFDLLDRNHRGEHKRELELKLILSSNFKAWNVSENFITERNFSEQGSPWEYGYAFAVSRPLAAKASPRACTICRENVDLGAELYGGLGDDDSFGFRETSHYLAPMLALRTPAGATFRISPSFGLNSNSNGFLFRFGVSYEIEQIFSKLRRR